jgi:hypothetical protein
MWEHHGMSGYQPWRGVDRTRRIGLADDSEDAEARAAAPAMIRLRRVVVVAVAPVDDDR